jgi:hypothetical protein
MKPSIPAIVQFLSGIAADGSYTDDVVKAGLSLLADICQVIPDAANYFQMAQTQVCS